MNTEKRFVAMDPFEGTPICPICGAELCCDDEGFLPEACPDCGIAIEWGLEGGF